jgi:phosphoglycerate dehydrogenase-like enzyme
MSLLCAVAPGPPAPAVAEAITAAGAVLADPDAAEALVWTDPTDAAGLSEVLGAAPGVRWVQLPFAGVDRFAGLFDDGRTWTSTKGAYSEPVAEHALALGLAGLRQLPRRARATAWGDQAGLRLAGSRVTVVGGGGITRSLLALLAPFGVEATVVRRHPAPVPGATEVVATEALHDALAGARLVVLALALTPETTGLIGTAELECMEADAWLVNVARGAHVVTDELVAALQAGAIGGAALDVTDPEPLPDGHPLWSLPNVLITPHVGGAVAGLLGRAYQLVHDQLRRYATGEPLINVVTGEY